MWYPVGRPAAKRTGRGVSRDRKAGVSVSASLSGTLMRGLHHCLVGICCMTMTLDFSSTSNRKIAKDSAVPWQLPNTVAVFRDRPFYTTKAVSQDTWSLSQQVVQKSCSTFVYLVFSSCC